MNKLRTLNWTYYIVKTVVYGFLFGAAAISFSHIVDVSTTMGLTWEAWTVPFFIDGLAVLGKIGRSRKFAPKTQRAGLVLMAIGGALSLGANWSAGDNDGQRWYGVLVVAGFIIAEWYAGKLEAAPAAQNDEPAPTAKPRRVIGEQEKAARKRAGYSNMTATEKAAWTKRYQERIARTAPQSPAWAVKGQPTAAELEAATA